MIELLAGIHLETSEEGVEVRQLVEADAQAMYDVVNIDTSHFVKYKEFAIPSTCRSLLELQRRLSSGGGRFAHVQYGIFGTEAGLMGAVTVYPDERNRSVDVSYWVGAQYIGHHYAATALNALAGYLFRPEVGVVSMRAEVRPSNTPSIKTLDRAGFRLSAQFANPITLFFERPNLAMQ